MITGVNSIAVLPETIEDPAVITENLAFAVRNCIRTRETRHKENRGEDHGGGHGNATIYLAVVARNAPRSPLLRVITAPFFWPIAHLPPTLPSAKICKGHVLP